MLISRGRWGLRPMEHGDLRMVLDWRNQERVSSMMFTTNRISWEEHERWFQAMKDDQTRPQLIFEMAGRALGVVSFSGIGSHDRVASWGFYIGDPNAGRGAGTRMLCLAIELAFTQLGVRKLSSEVLSCNKASVAVHERLGFRTEGLLLKQKVRSDCEGDVVLFGLLDEEWERSRQAIMASVFNEGEDETHGD